MSRHDWRSSAGPELALSPQSARVLPVSPVLRRELAASLQPTDLPGLTMHVVRLASAPAGFSRVEKLVPTGRSSRRPKVELIVNLKRSEGARARTAKTVLAFGHIRECLPNGCGVRGDVHVLPADRTPAILWISP